MEKVTQLKDLEESYNSFEKSQEREDVNQAIPEDSPLTNSVISSDFSNCQNGAQISCKLPSQTYGISYGLNDPLPTFFFLHFLADS